MVILRIEFLDILIKKSCEAKRKFHTESKRSGGTNQNAIAPMQRMTSFFKMTCFQSAFYYFYYTMNEGPKKSPSIEALRQKD